jgi:hypothetical protein
MVPKRFKDGLQGISIKQVHKMWTKNKLIKFMKMEHNNVLTISSEFKFRYFNILNIQYDKSRAILNEGTKRPKHFTILM